MNRQPRDIGASFRVSDALWERIRPLLPGERPKPQGGCPRNDDRKICVELIGTNRKAMAKPRK